MPPPPPWIGCQVALASYPGGHHYPSILYTLVQRATLRDTREALQRVHLIWTRADNYPRKLQIVTNPQKQQAPERNIKKLFPAVNAESSDSPLKVTTLPKEAAQPYSNPTCTPKIMRQRFSTTEYLFLQSIVKWTGKNYGVSLH